MRPDRVIVDAPPFNEQSGFFKTNEPFLIQTFFSKAAIEAFDVTVLCWFAGIDEVQLDLVLLGPDIQRFASELRSIVNLEQLGLAKLPDDLLQDTHHSLAAQTGIDLDAQATPGEDIDEVESSKAASVAEPVTGKVHRPHLVDGLGSCGPASFLALESLVMLRAQVELFFFVDAIRSFGIELPALQTQSTT